MKKTMELESEEKILETIRVRSYKGTPFFYVRTFTREELGKQFTREDLEEKSLVWLLRKIAFHSGEQSQCYPELSRRGRTSRHAHRLGPAPDHLDHRDEGGEVIENVIDVARPDMYQIRNSLKLARRALHGSR